MEVHLIQNQTSHPFIHSNVLWTLLPPCFSYDDRKRNHLGSICCSDGVGGRDEKVSGVLERPRVYFSRQTAQVILIPHRATPIHPLPLWAPTVLKYCPFKMCCPSDCAVHQSDLDEAPQFQDERLPLQTNSTNVLNPPVRVHTPAFKSWADRLNAGEHAWVLCDRHRPDVSAMSYLVCGCQEELNKFFNLEKKPSSCFNCPSFSSCTLSPASGGLPVLPPPGQRPTLQQ